MHLFDAVADGLKRKPCCVSILSFINAKRTTVIAVIGNENRNCCSTKSGFIIVLHTETSYHFKLQ